MSLHYSNTQRKSQTQHFQSSPFRRSPDPAPWAAETVTGLLSQSPPSHDGWYQTPLRCCHPAKATDGTAQRDINKCFCHKAVCLSIFGDMMPAGIMNNSNKQVKEKGSDGVIISVCIHCHIHLLCAFLQSKSAQYINNHKNHRYFEITKSRSVWNLQKAPQISAELENLSFTKIYMPLVLDSLFKYFG